MKYKIKHLICGAIIAFVVGMPVCAEAEKLFPAMYAAILSAAIAGAAKEYADAGHKMNHFCWKDFIATVVGGLIGAMFIYLIFNGKG